MRKPLTIIEAIKEYRDPYLSPSEDAFDVLCEYVYQDYKKIFEDRCYEMGMNDYDTQNKRDRERDQFIHEQLDILLNPFYDN